MGQFVNLQEEATAQYRTELAMKIVLASLMRVHGVTLRKSMDRVGEGFSEGFSTTEVNGAIDRLVNMGILKHVPETDLLSIADKDDGGAPMKMGRLYQFLLKRPIPVAALSSPWYDSHIDSQLIREICEIQGGLPLTDEQAKRVLEIVRLSPNALFAALAPIEMIVNHRINSVILPKVDSADVDTLFHTLHSNLERDFGSRALGEYFHETRKLVELEVNTSYKLKSSTRVELEDKIKKRSIIAQLSPDIVSGNTVFIHMLALNDAPEPWEDRVGVDAKAVPSPGDAVPPELIPARYGDADRVQSSADAGSGWRPNRHHL